MGWVAAVSPDDPGHDRVTACPASVAKLPSME